jgi:hypothetical protein
MNHILDRVPYVLIVQDLSTRHSSTQLAVNHATDQTTITRTSVNVTQYTEVEISDVKQAAKLINELSRRSELCFYTMPVGGGARTLVDAAKKWAKLVLEH